MKQIIQNNNKQIENNWIKKISSLPNFQKKETCVRDEAFSLPIVKTSEKENQQIKNLLK